MNHIQLKEILDASGIRNIEAALLFRVAQTTLTRWLTGVPPKQIMVYEIACRVAALIEKATEQHLLPVRDVRGKERLTAIKAAIRTVAN